MPSILGALPGADPCGDAHTSPGRRVADPLGGPPAGRVQPSPRRLSGSVRTLRIAKLDWIRATPGRRDRISLWITS